MHAAPKFVVIGMLAGCAAGAGGCDDSPVDPSAGEAAVESRKHENNAPVLNTASLNGFSLNGFSLNGFSLNGFSLNGFSLNGFSLNGFSLNGTSFHGTQLIDGEVEHRNGTDLIGATLTLTSAVGRTFVLTIEDIQLDEDNPAGEVYLYDVSVFDVFAGITTPLCTQGGHAVPAIPLVNHWNPVTGDRTDDPSVVTFACRGGALAKCVDWGYLPWSTATRCEPGLGCSEVAMTDHHQACSRMVRADYCGDGTPHTLTGTPIDIYDALSPQIQAAASFGQTGWGIEAEWGPDGAVCVGAERRSKMLDDLGIVYAPPTCLGAIDDIPSCGDLDPARDGLVADRYCDDWTLDPAACGES